MAYCKKFNRTGQPCRKFAEPDTGICKQHDPDYRCLSPGCKTNSARKHGYCPKHGHYCDVCGHRFTTKPSLQRHYLTETHKRRAAAAA